MSLMMITGASGFLGRRAAIYFKDKYEILTPTHSQMDITDEKSVEQYFVENRPDIVIHCAAISDVGRCEREPELSWDINVKGCVNIAKASLLVGAKCIQCSSDQVYFGSLLKEPHKESEKLSPYNLYGREKLMAEELCLAINPDCVFLRLSWMYDTESICESEHSDFMRTLLPKLQSDEKLSYAVYDMRGISNVREVICNLEKTFILPGGVYNFGSSNNQNMYDTMHEIFCRLGLDTERIKANYEAFCDNPRNITMDQSKIEAYDICFSTTVENIMNSIEYYKIK